MRSAARGRARGIGWELLPLALIVASLAATLGLVVAMHRRAAESPHREHSEAPPKVVVTPQAEHVHRANADVPEEIIAGLAEIGAFGLSVPAEYGGYNEGGDSEYLAMVIATEESASASVVSVFRSFIFSSMARSFCWRSRSFCCSYMSRIRMAISRSLMGLAIASGEKGFHS